MKAIFCMNFLDPPFEALICEVCQYVTKFKKLSTEAFETSALQYTALWCFFAPFFVYDDKMSEYKVSHVSNSKIQKQIVMVRHWVKFKPSDYCS